MATFDGDRYYYVTRKEFKTWLEMLEAEYDIVWTFSKSSKREVWIETLHAGPKVVFNLRGLVAVPGKGLCYARGGDEAQVYRVDVGNYSGGDHNLYGEGARSTEAWNEVDLLNDILIGN